MKSVDLSTDVLTHFANRARRLYTLPSVALRVLELTGQADVDVQQLADCIEQDPALTIKILRTVNSSLFGLSERVSNVKQSIALLGSQPLKMLVLGFSLPGNLASSSGAVVLQRYWQQALLTALAAREIAEQWFESTGDDEFAAGLLQDLGLLLLVQDLGEPYEKFLVSVWQEQENLLDAERDVLGFDHQSLTTSLMKHWRLPDAFVASIERARLAESIDDDRAAHVLYLANLLTDFLINRRTECLRTLLRAGEQSCGLSKSRLESLVAVLEQKIPQLADVLSIELPGEAVYSDILLQAYRRLCEASDQVASHWLLPTQRPNTLLWERVTEASESEGILAERQEFENETWVTPELGGPPREQRPAMQRSLSSSTRAGLIGRISAEVAGCRQARSALSLVLVELDDLPRLNLIFGAHAMPQIVRQLGAAILELTDEEAVPSQVSDTRFAVLLRNCDRRRAVDFAWRITDSVRNWSQGQSVSLRAALSVSVGVASLAMPPRNFPTEELLTAAERCLTGVQLSGGDSVKSIDIY